MSGLCWLWGALVLVGLLGGVRWQLAERAHPVARSALCPECEVLAVDLHTHTRFSDGFLSPMELVLMAQREGLDVVAVTEHNMLFPAEVAAWFSALIGGPMVLTGQEVTTRDYHLIAVGLTERVAPAAELRHAIDAIHRQGGIAIAAHPTRRYWPAFDEVRDVLDAAEVVHPAAFGGSTSFRWDDMVAFFERPGAKPLTAVGSSDYHFFRTLGVCRTEVLVKARTPEAVLAALRDGDTRVTAPDGRRFGRWGADEPPTPREPIGYGATDGLDGVTRVLGWLGVVGLSLFGVRGRRERRAPHTGKMR